VLLSERSRAVKNPALPFMLSFAAAIAFAQTAAAPKTTAAADSKSSVHVLSRAELDALLEKPERVLLIDVRRPDEISKLGGLPVYLSVQLDDLPRELAFIPRARSIITISNHAKRATTAADLLAGKGFKVVGALGVQTYEQEGGKLTRVPVPPASGSD
jgi:rhodanese-related sulfurtransferase